MNDHEDERRGRWRVWLGGAIALGAWFVMLWLMFGDVL